MAGQVNPKDKSKRHTLPIVLLYTVSTCGAIICTVDHFIYSWCCNHTVWPILGLFSTPFAI